jgi:hypothetical protein
MVPVFHYILVAIAASSLYLHPTCLNGDFVYDDGGTVTGNPVTLGQVPFEEVWRRDYWGKDDIRSKQSHKSFRPLTSISFRLNAQHSLATWGELHPFGFHVVNVALHTVVSLLCIPVTLFAFGKGQNAPLENTARKQCDQRAALATALIFAVHPVHSEAVQNITGRADVLMALIYLLGFWGYATVSSRDERIARQTGSLWPRKLLWVALFVWVPLLTLLSVLSKETGFTLPMLCSIWDFFVLAQLSLFDFRHVIPWTKITATEVPGDMSPRIRLRRWFVRTSFLTLGIIILMLWRISLNGGHEPYFRFNSNRQAIEPIKPSWAAWRAAKATAEAQALDFSQPLPPGYLALEDIVGVDHGVHGLFRWMSMAVVWAHYLGACVSPRPVLSCDWSGPSIPLVTSLNPQQDPRLFGVFAMGAAALCVLITGWVSRRRENARAGIKIAIGVRLHACAAFYVFPFLLSSNIFVVTGTTVAERVVYLPSLGVCMGYGLLASGWLDGESWSGPFGKFLPFGAMFPFGMQRSRRQTMGRLIALSILLAAMAQKCVERSFAWSNQVDLWASAFAVSPRNAHTSQNYGVNLSLSGPEGVAKAIVVLGAATKLPLLDRCDSEEIFPTLAMCLNAVGRVEDALQTLAQGWVELEDLAVAARRGVMLWHMNEVKAGQGWERRDALSRARLLAVQGHVLSRLDAVAAAQAMALAASFGPGDPLVRRLSMDLERDFRLAIEQQ